MTPVRWRRNSRRVRHRSIVHSRAGMKACCCSHLYRSRLTMPASLASVCAPSEPRKPTMRLFSATIATETNTFSPLPTSLEAYKESVFLRPGEHPTDAPAHVHRAAVRRAPARRGRWLHPDRGKLLCRQSRRHHQPRRLRVHARRDPGAAQGRVTARWCAVRPARRDGRARLRRCRRRRAGTRPRHRWPGLRHRRRARSALPSYGEARAACRHHHPLQGVSRTPTWWSVPRTC